MTVPERRSNVKLTITKDGPRQPRNFGWRITLALLVGGILVFIGACIQVPHTIERASYEVVDAKIVEQRESTSKRKSIRRPRTSTFCTAQAAFTVNGVEHVTKLDAYANHCDHYNGEEIKIAYHPKDIYGTATTAVYKYNLHPVALMFTLAGSVIAGGAWLLSYVNVKSFKVRKRKR